MYIHTLQDGGGPEPLAAFSKPTTSMGAQQVDHGVGSCLQ